MSDLKVESEKEVYCYLSKDQPWGALGCGMNGISSFRFGSDGGGGYWGLQKLSTMKFQSGCKFACASIRDRPECKAAYEEMCARFPIVWQSEVRHNTLHPEKAHTGTFYVIWDCSSAAAVKKPRKPRTKKEEVKAINADPFVLPNLAGQDVEDGHAEEVV